MTILIILFGSLILLAGFLLLVKPEILFSFLQNNIENLGIHVIAVTTRLIVGALLVSQSSLSRFPLAIEVLGCVFIIAGFTLAAIGRSRFRKLMSWVLTNLKPLERVIGVIAIAFGGFLVYAFL